MQSRYEQFAASISGIYHAIQKIERNEMIRCGVKGVFAQYLAALQSHPDGLTAAQLCELCDRDKAAVSRTVAEMEQAGLVLRQAREDKMYRARVMLTEEGQCIAQYVTGRAQAAVEAGGRGLDAAQRMQLQEALALIAGNLDAICREGLSLE